MNWKEKFKIVHKDCETNEDIDSDFYIKGEGASESFLKQLKEEYPFLPLDYFEFLKFTNGADIAQCVLVGNDNFTMTVENYSDVFEKENWMPFAWAAGGDPLLIHKSGKVALGEGKKNKQEYIFVAGSFSEFLNEVLLGQKLGNIYWLSEDEHQSFYKEEKEDDTWIEYLIEQNWIKA